METENLKITGVMINYYFICKRKLWYFTNGIQMEQEHDNVAIGKLIDENSYSREKKHIMIDGVINIDFINGMKVIHEVKKSKAIEEAGIWQTKYYLYYLKKKGIDDIRAIIDYPVMRKREEIILDKNDESEIDRIIGDIKNITENSQPLGVLNNKICKSCAYFELCYI